MWVVNGILNSVKNGESKPVDMQIYDIKKCFDAMWTKETMNDLYEVAEKDDKLALLYRGNENCFISIKTPVGNTERVKIKDVEMQGSTWGPLKCSMQIDQYEKKVLKIKKIFLYTRTW